MKQGYFHSERLAAPNQEQAVYAIENNFEKELQIFFKKQKKNVTSFLKEKNFDPEAVKDFDWKSEDKALKDIYLQYVPDAYRRGQDFAFENVAKVMRKVNRKGRRWFRKYNIWVDFETPVPQAEALVARRPIELTNRWAPIPDASTIRIIQEELAFGYSEFESTAKLTKRVANVYEDCEKWRAELIARTETMRSFNDAGLDYYKATGVVDKVELIVATDACNECQDVIAGQKIYTLSEAGGILPIHPNCRCTWGPMVREESIGDDLLNEVDFDPSIMGRDYIRRMDDQNKHLRTMTDAYNNIHNTKFTVQEIKNKMTIAIKKEIENARVVINMDKNTIPQLLKDGRFKSQFETGRSGGLLNNNVRAEWEERFFGYSKNLAPKDRPIYGFLADSTDNIFETTVTYGDVSCILKKKNIISRTTFTWDDSLGAKRLQPTKLSNPTYEAAQYTSYKDINAFGKGKMTLKNINKQLEYDSTRTLYVESQIHNGVSVDDIDSILVRIKTKDDIIDREKLRFIYNIEEKRLGSTIKALDDSGINWDLVNFDGSIINKKEFLEIAKEYIQ